MRTETTERSADPTAQDDELIAKWIERDPYHPGKGDARVKEYGVHVWALVGHSWGVDGDATKVAKDYDLPLEAVEAALAYYRRYAAFIDDRLEADAW